MPHSLTWLPDVLKAAGLKVSEVDGWQNRGSHDIGTISGVICHHTAGPGPGSGNYPSFNTIIKGRPDLPGPLAQLGLGRDGTWIVFSAGRANHAGPGEFKDITTGHFIHGNSTTIGIEAENSGKPTDPWPAVQMDAYQRGVAAILTRIGKDSSFCAGHKEYARDKHGKLGRKPDPSFDMNAFRASLAAIMAGTAPPPVLIPAAEPPAVPGGPLGRPTLRRNAKGDLVKQIQAKLGVEQVGNFGPKTEAAVRAFQRSQGMVPDGIVGPKTWAALDKV
ncbi:MAG: peptidoglycan recognition protein family protein [Pyrinomonadaceae bacterium]